MGGSIVSFIPYYYIQIRPCFKFKIVYNILLLYEYTLSDVNFISYNYYTWFVFETINHIISMFNEIERNYIYIYIFVKIES